jgi:hypothetical protein
MYKSLSLPSFIYRLCNTVPAVIGLIYFTSNCSACDPLGPDFWFKENLAVDTKQLPTYLNFRQGKLYTNKSTNCAVKSASLYPISVQGIDLGQFCQGKEGQVFKDNRPMTINLPISETCRISVYCEQQDYNFDLSLNYIKQSSIKTTTKNPVYYLSESIDKKLLPKSVELIPISSAAQPVNYRIKTISDDYYCSYNDMSLERGEFISNFYYSEIGQKYPNPWTKKNSPSLSTIKFPLKLNCFKKLTKIVGKIEYTLNSNYNSTQEADSIEACKSFSGL